MYPPLFFHMFLCCFSLYRCDVHLNASRRVVLPLPQCDRRLSSLSSLTFALLDAACVESFPRHSRFPRRLAAVVPSLALCCALLRSLLISRLWALTHLSNQTLLTS